MPGTDQSEVVRMPDAVFTFDNIQYKGGALDAVLTVQRSAPSDPLLALDYDPDRAFRYHITASSLSNVTAYRRELEKFHGSDIAWGELIHEAIRLAEKQYVERIQSVDPQDVTETSAEYAVEGVFPYNRVSCVFGMGGSGKSLGVESATGAGSAGATWTGRMTIAGNWLWLDYENEDEGDFARRRQGLALGGIGFYPGSIRWMAGRGVPLPELVDPVRREMARFHCTGLVVDSVMFACGGDPTKAEIATGFYGALARLPLSTKILIAHTDKAENDKYPFGSIFWHNGIHGHSWFVKGVQREEENVLDMAWYGRKASNGPRQQDFALRFTFDDGAIFLQEGDLKAVNRETGRESEAVRLRRVLLMHGEMTVGEAAQETGISAANVAAYVSRMAKAGEVIKRPGHKWAMTAEEAF